MTPQERLLAEIQETQDKIEFLLNSMGIQNTPDNLAKLHLVQVMTEHQNKLNQVYGRYFDPSGSGI